MSPLPWGRRFLMCPPEHFGVLYEINPWMHREVTVDLDRAREEWGELVATLVEAGAKVELLEPQPGLPDLVFTANAGTVNHGTYVPARFRHPHRQPEVDHDVTWFEANGFEVRWLPDGVGHEGAGDALPFRNVFVSGYRSRSDAAAHGPLSTLIGAAVRPIELVDPRLYHLDLTFCPLDDRRAMVAPHAWDSYGRKVVEALVPEPLILEDDEMLAFCANSVVVDQTVVMATCPPRLGRHLEAWGFAVAEVDVGEFLKAGGSCRCLTLALDVAIPAMDAPPPSTGTPAAH
ncbi:MAG TPA: arginine deiminase-related protein [Acidimicrobiales bacterium]|nr:arginine deiminase-related protein [Acidimicrobiales bacterium]